MRNSTLNPSAPMAAMLARCGAVCGLSLAALGAGSALAHPGNHAQDASLLRSCEDARVGLRDLAIGRSSGARTFYEGDVLVMRIDQVEPAAAASGIVILAMIPDGEPGARRCLAATQFAYLDLDRATSAYDPREGLTLSIPARDNDPAGTSIAGKPLVVKINRATGAISAAR